MCGSAYRALQQQQQSSVSSRRHGLNAQPEQGGVLITARVHSVRRDGSRLCLWPSAVGYVINLYGSAINTDAGRQSLPLLSRRPLPLGTSQLSIDFLFQQHSRMYGHYCCGLITCHPNEMTKIQIYPKGTGKNWEV